MFNQRISRLLAPALSVTLCWAAGAQTSAPTGIGSLKVPLKVEAGTPLRLYLTERAGYHLGQMVHGRFAEPVWAFDRIVIPAGTSVQGTITSLRPVSKYARTLAIVRGDFTPLKEAEVSFGEITPSGGKPLGIDSTPSLGLASIYIPPRPGKNGKAATPSSPQNTRSAGIKAFIKQQALTQANSRSNGFLDFVRGPNKREWLENFLWSKLPYHPQSYRSGTRFDAVLDKPLDFGETEVPMAALKDVGTVLPSEHAALVRLVSTVSSGDAKVGDPIEGVLSEPVFSAHHTLVFPQGTRLDGKVTLVRAARMFHRGGQLRFAFNRIEPNLPALAPLSPEPTFGQLTAAESSTGTVKIDEEGTAKATESKTRFLRPIIAGLIAAKSIDDDAGKQNASAGANANYSGRSLGGFSGFGLFGTLASFGPKPIGGALGYYGLAWSVYSTVISRGHEVTFEKNSALGIRFAAPSR